MKGAKQILFNLSWYNDIVKKSIHMKNFSADSTEPKRALRKSKPWPNTSAVGNTIGIALLAIAADAVVAVLATKSVLPGTAVLVRETTGLEILLTVKVAYTLVEVDPVVMGVSSKQVPPKAKAAVGEGIAPKVE